MNNIKNAAPNDFLWCQIIDKRLLIEFEYLVNFNNLKILRARINLRSTVGKNITSMLGRIAIKSISAGKLMKYFNLVFKFVPLELSFSTQDHRRARYSRRNIKTERYSKTQKKLR